MATATAKPAFAHPGARKRPRNGQTQRKNVSGADGQHQADAELEKGKKIFLQIGDHAGRAHRPAQADKIAAKNNILPQAGFLDGLHPV